VPASVIRTICLALSVVWSVFGILTCSWKIGTERLKYATLKVCDNGRFITPCWILPLVWGILDIHVVSHVVFTFVIGYDYSDRFYIIFHFHMNIIGGSWN
jgi:hypothetical protein